MKPYSLFSRAIVICLATAIAVELQAQEVAGSLSGLVRGPDGNPLISVQAAVTGRELLGTRVDVSDRNGVFRFIALPPGEYTVRLRRLGMRPIAIERVQVQIGRTTTIPPVTLEAQAVEMAELRIVSNGLSLDPTHADVGGTINAADYTVLPGERDYKSMMAILPHINETYRGDAVNSAGATGLENMYFIDGVNVTSGLNASSGTSLPYNFIRAVEVKSGGYEAQYGKGLGAIVNAVTYSGTNDFEMSMFAFGTRSNFGARPKSQPALQSADGFSYDVGVRVGGPVVRDRLWYSAAYNPKIESVDRHISGLGVFTDKRVAHLFAGKLTWQPAPMRTVELSVFGDPTVHHAVEIPGGADVYTPLEADPYLARRELGGFIGSIRGSWKVGNTLIEASASQSSGKETIDGDTQRGRTTPFYRDDVARTVAGGWWFSSGADLKTTTLKLRSTITPTNHTIIAGAEYEDVAADRRLGLGGGYWVDRLAPNVYTTNSEGGPGTFHNRVPTFYLQDAWRAMDALTLNAGVRLSTQSLIGASGSLAQRFAGEWQPRMGIVWQPTAAGDQRAFATYGRFYQQEPLNFTSLWYVDYPEVHTFFSSDPRIGGVRPDSTHNFSTLESDIARNIATAQAENIEEYTVGYERKVRSMRLTARLMQRRLLSSYQFALKPGVGFVLGTPGRGDFDFLPKATRRYTALELSGEGGIAETTIRASYVLSRNRGNYSGLFQSDLGLANPGSDLLFFMPHQAVNSEGLLPNDRTHVIKVALARPLVRGLSAGGFFTWQSGSPLNAFGANPNGFPFRAFAFAEPRGSSGRSPALFDINLRLTHESHPTARGASRVVVDLLHVGNPQRAVRLDELKYLSNVNGVFSGVSPDYLRPVSFQPPMTMRLGLEVSY